MSICKWEEKLHYRTKLWHGILICVFSHLWKKNCNQRLRRLLSPCCNSTFLVKISVSCRFWGEAWEKSLIFSYIREKKIAFCTEILRKENSNFLPFGHERHSFLSRIGEFQSTNLLRNYGTFVSGFQFRHQLCLESACFLGI